ncbi:hypothetical protein [Mycolicibacterium austroafricanum]|uniref:hypothetical protein n=1 Tax=Mycolicibacterium austroafricanum TaxID=39687 RepID=UPI00130EF3E0|nr:hypothetical protein [Mycolicibacterium austroafricanum]QZY47265.1 hypothetical protein K5L12_05900 [Mycolicibacterium austroafricanum]
MKGVMFGPASTPQTAAHIDYERRQCPGTGATYLDDAIRFMRELGRAALSRSDA